ncbi:MAG TPA: hypothetical protein DDY14_02740 [Chromatiaceae bacterium]|nr:MAG: hypothetical protein N838_10810 [Thiohalocapsa sp. PB-PSB1]HBG94244.1 hypothetical protein [Chromatiaceae bacterium]
MLAMPAARVLLPKSLASNLGSAGRRGQGIGPLYLHMLTLIMFSGNSGVDMSSRQLIFSPP